MTTSALDNALIHELDRLRNGGTFKNETLIESRQGATVRVGGKDVIMLASNNYLGLASDPRIVDAAIRGVRDYGYGVSSVRFICGTLTIHRQLEEAIAAFLGTEDSILFSSCYAANEAFFAAIVNDALGRDGYKDVIYSDRLNHASIIDGTRLCRSPSVDRKIFGHRDADELGRMLRADRERGYRFGIVATDGVFSMEGDLAPLVQLREATDAHDRLLFVDDSHGVGVVGNRGRGSPEALGLHGRIDALSGTLGKALGGAAGGYIAGSRILVEFLRQKARPYTFSNSIAPGIVTASLEALRILESDTGPVERLRENTAYFRSAIQSLGFTTIEGTHPIVPIMLGEAGVAMEMSASLLDEGVYIKGLWHPVVPEGEARLRAQISAALERTELDRALGAMERVGRRTGVI